MLSLIGTAHAEETMKPLSTPDELKLKSQWTRTHLTDVKLKAGALPFAFVYGGQPSEKLLADWPRKVETKKIDAARTQHTMRWTDPKTGLEVRCVAVDYSDYPAVDWTVWFKNNGKQDTPVLKSIQGIDTIVQKTGDGEFVLHGNKGDWCVRESYEPFLLTLGPDTNKRFAPAGGRPTNGPDGWPYYNLKMPGGGAPAVDHADRYVYPTATGEYLVRVPRQKLPNLNWADRSDIYYLKHGRNTFEIRQDPGDSGEGLMIDYLAVSREPTCDEGRNIAPEATATSSSGEAAKAVSGCAGCEEEQIVTGG